MTTRGAFSNDEWELLLQGPSGAAMLVMTSQSGGIFRESFSMAKAYTDARAHPGQSELVDELVSSRPQIPNAHDKTPDELREDVLAHLNDAVTLLRVRATETELEQYRQFVISVADSVARAHREGTNNDPVSNAERDAIVAITNALGPSSEASA